MPFYEDNRTAWRYGPGKVTSIAKPMAGNRSGRKGDARNTVIAGHRSPGRLGATCQPLLNHLPNGSESKTVCPFNDVRFIHFSAADLQHPRDIHQMLLRPTLPIVFHLLDDDVLRRSEGGAVRLSRSPDKEYEAARKFPRFVPTTHTAPCESLRATSRDSRCSFHSGCSEASCPRRSFCADRHKPNPIASLSAGVLRLRISAIMSSMTSILGKCGLMMAFSSAIRSGFRQP